MGNLWDVGGATNWLSGGNPDVFRQGDAVFFDPTGSTSPALSLSGLLAPTSLTMSNTAAYTFGGSGGITGGALLTKQGPGAWTLGTANDFAGAVTVEDGTLVVSFDEPMPPSDRSAEKNVVAIAATPAAPSAR